MESLVQRSFSLGYGLLMQVQTYCTESDQIQLVYFTEPESVYTLEVTPELYAGKLILVKPVVK